MNELPVESTNEHENPNPVERYIDRVIEDAQNGFTSYIWEVIPKSETSEQGVHFRNAEDCLNATLMKHNEADFIMYSLTVRGPDAEIVFKSTDWDFEKTGNTSLGRMYTAVQTAIAQAEQDITNTENSSEDAAFVDRFITALLQDARGKSRRLFYDRNENGAFVSDSFGISETRIVISKDWESENADQHTVKLEFLDGSEVFSCTDRCKFGSEEEDLRELYQLLEQQYPATKRDVAMEDAQRFIDQKTYDAYLDKLMERNLPFTDAKVDELPLVSDILRTVSPRTAVQRLMEEAAVRRGVMPAPDYKRVREFVEGVATAICNTARSPSGATYWTDTCNSRSPLVEIANAKCGWVSDVFGGVEALLKKNVATQCAVLILASIVVDQLL